jgi:hypothetical protein
MVVALVHIQHTKEHSRKFRYVCVAYERCKDVSATYKQSSFNITA